MANIITLSHHKDVSDKNAIRIEEQRKQYLYYSGDAFNIKHYLTTALEKSYDQEDVEEMQLQWLNITEKIINQMSVVYSQPATRKIIIDDKENEELTDYYLKIIPKNINTLDKESHRLAKLSNVSLPHVLFDERTGRFNYKVIPSYLYDIKHEYGVLTEISYEKFFKEQGEDVWYAVYYTEDEHYRVDAYGNKSEIPDSKDFNNPLGFIPFPVFRLKNSVDFWGEGQADIINVNEQVNLMLTKLWNSDLIMGTEGTVLAINLDLLKKGTEEQGRKKVRTGRKHPIAVENVPSDGAQPSLQHITTSPYIGETKDAIDWYIKMIANFNGLNPSTILSMVKDTSDYQKTMDAVEQMEIRKDDIEPCRAFEEDRFEITKKMNNIYSETPMGKKFELKNIPEDAELAVDFGDIEIHKTPQDMRDDWDWRLEKNLITLIDIVKEGNPDLTDEEAGEFIAENKRQNSTLTGKSSKFELLTQQKKEETIITEEEE